MKLCEIGYLSKLKLASNEFDKQKKSNNLIKNTNTKLED